MNDSEFTATGRVDELLHLAASEGYQVQVRQWLSGELWRVDIKVLTGHGRTISSRGRHCTHPGGMMDRLAAECLDDTRRHMQAQRVGVSR